VTGKVLYADGQTLPAGGTITLELASAPHYRASGRIEADGSFELSTEDLGPGAVEGEHRARIDPEVPDSIGITAGYDAAKAKIVDSKFLQFDTSGLKYSIGPGENVLTVTVERP
jgi:hypothetical protein